MLGITFNKVDDIVLYYDNKLIKTFTTSKELREALKVQVNYDYVTVSLKRFKLLRVLLFCKIFGLVEASTDFMIMI